MERTPARRKFLKKSKRQQVHQEVKETQPARARRGQTEEQETGWRSSYRSLAFIVS